MSAPRPLGRNAAPRRPRLLGALLLLCLLLPAGPYAPAAPAQAPEQIPHFTGLVQYDPGGGDLLPQAGVPVFLYGYPQSGGPPVLLRSALTAPDGSFDLYTRTAAFSAYVVLKDEMRGLVPFTATPGLNGRLWDPSAVFYPGDSNNHTTHFLVRDALRFATRFRERYLIVTSAAVVPGLEDFIAYKEFLGFDVQVITVEELDPAGIGGQFRRDQIRAYERSLYESPGGLKYVLLIGTDETIPFLKVAPDGPDWVRYPYEEWWDECKYAGVPHEANMCGFSTDWYYVDLYSDWDSNHDGVLGEGFWAPPKKVKDNPPAFHVDVYLGRLPFDSPATVKNVLNTIMAFEQDDGDWKKHVLLAGAMSNLGGWAWDPPDNTITGTYKPVLPTDNAYLMEHAYSGYLSGEGFQRVRLYEKDHPPNCSPPSSFPVDAPLTLENVTDEWTSHDFGLVKAAGHGSHRGVARQVWVHDYETPCVVENPTRPISNGKSLYEVEGQAFLWRDYTGQVLSPSGKSSVLMALSCSTGAWYDANNLAAAYLAAGRVAAWIGATGLIHYTCGWTSPSQEGGQAVDYLVGKAIFKQDLPLGDGFWTGLDNFRQQFGANWGNGRYTSAFLSLDLYGDPSMDFWGNGADVRGPWPMFHYDWAGLGQTPLAGPGLIGQTYWTVDIAPTPAGSRVPAPVINRDDRIVIGDASGVVRSIDMAGNVLWSYPTDGPIDTAPALGLGGTIYVQTRNGTLYAIRENGTLYWSRTVGQSDASPKVGPNGWIYVGGSDSNGPGGSTRYLMMAYRIDGERKGMIEVDGRVTTTPSFDKQGQVWVGTANGTVYRLVPRLTGGIDLPFAPGHAIGDGLAFSDDQQTLLVPTSDGQLMGYRNWVFEWQFSTGAPVRSAPAVSQDGTVVFGSQDGKVYALRIADGAKLWEYDTGGPVDSSPALDAVFAYVVGGNPARLYALRIADGTFFPGAIEIGGSAQGGSSPAIGESKMLYVASAEGALYAIGKINLPQPPKLYARAWPWEIVVQIQPGDPSSWHLLERRLPGGQWDVRAELGPGVTEFHDSTVQPGLRYQYRALAYDGIAKNAAGTQQQPEYSEYSPIVPVQALRAVPEAPAAPTVTPLSSSELRLEWTAAPTASIGLRVWRLDPGAPDYAEIALLPGEATSFDDSELLSNTIYFYRLQAVDEAGDSPLSEPGSGTTWARTLPPPRQVTVYPLEDWTFRVCWVPGGSGYESVVARAAAGEMEAGEIGRVAPGQTCFTDTHGFPSSFVYQVKHVAGQDESEWALSAPTEPPDWLVVHTIYLPVVLKSAGP